VNISNLSCSNMWAGIAPYQPASRAFNDFTVTGWQLRAALWGFGAVGC
jgi:hypothetical protein